MTKKGTQSEITLGWLYPELMSTYGDRGNIMVLTKRMQRRGIAVNILPIDFDTSVTQIKTCDMVFGGGAQDRQQGILIADLRKRVGPVLKALFDKDIPGLFVCGAPQLLGHWYVTGEGEKLDGLGIFDMVSRHFGKAKPRCIGNLVARIDDRFRLKDGEYRNTIIGFENHGGRTYLGDDVQPFATVLSGFGNNGEDKTEGAVYKHCIATYSHGPFLPKNPHIADYLIATSLAVKYGKEISLSSLDDTLAWKAHDVILNKIPQYP